MIARRRNARPATSSCHSPRPSGPRWSIAAPIAARASAGGGPPPTMPAMPHTRAKLARDRLAIRGSEALVKSARVRPLRVLHCPTDVGGHPSGLARAERELGLDSHVVAFEDSPFRY